jgi:hypothetical protein
MADRKSRPRPYGPQFSGILNEPIQLLNPLALALQSLGSAEVQASRSKAIDDYLFQQRFKRICALADHYDVKLVGPHGSFEVGLYKLLLKLAEDFVPGFKTEAPRRPGRPKGTGKGNAWELVMAIEGLIPPKGRHTVTAACSHLNKSSKSPWRGEGARALQERYRRFLGKKNKRSGIDPDLEMLYQRLAKMGADEMHEN